MYLRYTMDCWPKVYYEYFKITLCRRHSKTASKWSIWSYKVWLNTKILSNKTIINWIECGWNNKFVVFWKEGALYNQRDITKNLLWPLCEWKHNSMNIHAGHTNLIWYLDRTSVLKTTLSYTIHQVEYW